MEYFLHRHQSYFSLRGANEHTEVVMDVPLLAAGSVADVVMEVSKHRGQTAESV